ncbi:MAG: 4-hydroxy-tetrahydrodipicolinate reductase [Pseudomonadota bacterium]
MKEARFIIAGCGGAMGRAVIEAALAAGAAIAGGVERDGAPCLGADLGALVGAEPIGAIAATLAETRLAPDNVIIDFTSPAASLALAEAAAAAGAAHVMASTGFSADEDAAVAALAQKVPIVKSGNMSLGVNLLCALVEKAARALDDRYDIEITEAHHRRKVDAPSGTALMLADAAATGRGVSLKAHAAHDRRGARVIGDIGFAVSRGGGVVGDHDVAFAGDREVVAFSHRAIDRGLFADGALTAARWVHGRAPGLYSMRDVLGV